MANKDGHRRFGNILALSSGRFQIRYPGPDGRLRTGTTTYASKTLADRALTMIESQMVTGEWTDPQRGQGQARRVRGEVDRAAGQPAGPDGRAVYLAHRPARHHRTGPAAAAEGRQSTRPSGTLMARRRWV